MGDKNLIKGKILFIPWDGAQVTYLNGLFLSIFSQLVKQGYKVKVLQFTWSDKNSIKVIKNKLGFEGIEYEAVAVNKKYPLNLGYPIAIFRGIFKIRRIIRREGYNIIMPRTILPSLMCLLARVSEKVRLVYDSDGFPHDERVDFQGWKSTGLAYQFYRLIEFLILHKSEAIITRSKRAKATLIARAGSKFDNNKIFILWNGRDSDMFKLYPHVIRMKLREKLAIKQNQIVFLYSGSVGEKYLTSKLLSFFNYLKLKNQDCVIIILTTQTKELESIAFKANYSLDNYIIKTVSQADVCDYLNMADFGIFFCKKTFSTEAVFPTKLSEYLLTGLPSIISAGIGDCDEIALNKKGLFSVDEYDEITYNEIFNWVEKITKISDTIREENQQFAKQALTTDLTKQIITEAIEYSEKDSYRR